VQRPSQVDPGRPKQAQGSPRPSTRCRYSTTCSHSSAVSYGGMARSTKGGGPFGLRQRYAPYSPIEGPRGHRRGQGRPQGPPYRGQREALVIPKNPDMAFGVPFGPRKARQDGPGGLVGPLGSRGPLQPSLCRHTAMVMQCHMAVDEVDQGGGGCPLDMG
jgi:hypothetical protein